MSWYGMINRLEVTLKRLKSTAGEQYWQTQVMGVFYHCMLIWYGRPIRMPLGPRVTLIKLLKPPLMTGKNHDFIGYICVCTLVPVALLNQKSCSNLVVGLLLNSFSIFLADLCSWWFAVMLWLHMRGFFGTPRRKKKKRKKKTMVSTSLAAVSIYHHQVSFMESLLNPLLLLLHLEESSQFGSSLV